MDASVEGVGRDIAFVCMDLEGAEAIREEDANGSRSTMVMY